MTLILFDCDGTLVDSQHAIVEAMTEAFGARGHPLPPREELLGVVGLSLPQAMGALVPHLGEAEAEALAETGAPRGVMVGDTEFDMAMARSRHSVISPPSRSMTASLSIPRASLPKTSERRQVTQAPGS